ncbi:MAG: homoserine dehydrogenase [Rhodospirillaceae bacterium]|nr:homoserine dehydrogenase [Rhodospirillaceae bacterium]
MRKPLKISIAGLGTVGTGVIELLLKNGSEISRKCEREIEVVAVSALNPNRDRGVDITSFQWFDDPVAMAREIDCDVFVELIGGESGVAKDSCEAAILAGKSVVTANKALIAKCGTDLAFQAEKNNLGLAFEAAVAGGIPIVKSIKEGLAGNKIAGLYGILNGTCNYILTTMRETGRDFQEVLFEAQELGYAEADPGFDVDGIDTAHKLSILSSLAFGNEVNFSDTYIEGIRHISALDIKFANELGYRIKLLGIAQSSEDGVVQRVHPCMLRFDSPVSHVEGVYNAIVVQGDFLGPTVYEGRGAGAGPTASAVVADLVDLARGMITPAFGKPASELDISNVIPIERHIGSYYIRLMVLDRPGVFADVAGVLRDEEVSMEGILQRTRSPDESVPVVMTTHDVEEGAIRRVINRFAEYETVVEKPRIIRIEPLLL